MGGEGGALRLRSGRWPCRALRLRSGLVALRSGLRPLGALRLRVVGAERDDLADELVLMEEGILFVFLFEKLDVWCFAVDLVDYVFDVLERFPKNKHFRLIGQMESAVSSIAQNIAEGKGRQHKKEFIQFLYIAEGSLFEVLTLAILFRRRDLITEKELQKIRKQSELIDRKLRGLINYLRTKDPKAKRP